MIYWLVGLFWALSVVDYFLTKKILAGGGKELNPIMAWALRQGVFAPLKGAIAFICGSFIVYYNMMFLAILADAAMLFVCWWNWRQACSQAKS